MRGGAGKQPRWRAQLEAARAETAALRLVQSAPPGTRIVLGVPDAAALSDTD
ncbi:hypothetical protein [Terrabacter terrigena]|uniref:Uncharacterized protein n=1 Tax=Terrabacter terrigena TaxID=574718 RepID=A0ABW3N1L4_9MICO